MKKMPVNIWNAKLKVLHHKRRYCYIHIIIYHFLINLHV